MRYLGFWRNRQYHLDQMGLRELTVAYVQYYAIQAYVLIGLGAAALAWLWMTTWIGTLASGLAAVFLYPLLWFLIHRYILHSKLYRWPFTAKVWKRIHYDHHRDPNDLKVLFGALYTTLPTVALATLPVGWLLGGAGGAMAALSAGVFTTCFYEYCHCIQHLGTQPDSRFLSHIKAAHLAHHFYNENGNFGITNLFWDKLFGTYYAASREMPKSPTVFNLGYDEETASMYPWVARLDSSEAESPA